VDHERADGGWTRIFGDLGDPDLVVVDAQRREVGVVLKDDVEHHHEGASDRCVGHDRQRL
jgi:hypothetical protein